MKFERNTLCRLQVPIPTLRVLDRGLVGQPILAASRLLGGFFAVLGSCTRKNRRFLAAGQIVRPPNMELQLTPEILAKLNDLALRTHRGTDELP